MSSHRLIDLMHGRDNNLNLMRMVAATMVLVSHSFALALGGVAGEPWRARLAITPGSVAVEIFFIISGMLLTHSLLKRRSTVEFIQARALRIYPGLIVAMVLTVFVLGPLLTQLDLASYFQHKQTWKHFIKNVLAFTRIEFFLPGVFEQNKANTAVNGSIWTLRHEILSYLALLGAWVVSTFVRRDAVFKTLTLVIFAAVFAYRWYLLSVEPLEESHARLYAAFFTGAALRVVADKVPVSTAWMLGAVALLIAGVVYPTIFPWIYTLTLPYLVLYAAYGVAGPLRAYNRMGDYSYGTYIYAFPIQQLVVALMPGVTPWGLTLYAMAATLVFAVASWHWVEQPASRWRWRRLSLKPDYAAG